MSATRHLSDRPSLHSNELFEKQWQLYQKVLKNNYMGHRELYDVYRNGFSNVINLYRDSLDTTQLLCFPY